MNNLKNRIQEKDLICRMKSPQKCVIFETIEQPCYKVAASLTCKRREVVRMEMFSFQDLILFATFLITLLAYIDRKNKRKKSLPCHLAGTRQALYPREANHFVGGCSFYVYNITRSNRLCKKKTASSNRNLQQYRNKAFALFKPKKAMEIQTGYSIFLPQFLTRLA